MKESPEVKGTAERDEPVNLRVFMPKGLAMHIMQSIPRREQPGEEIAANTQFCLEMEKLFRALGTADIDAAVVLVKIREDKTADKVDDQGQKVVVDGVQQTEAVAGFSLGGGMTGPAEELMPMVMYLTESIQTAEADALRAKNPPPEGKTEADRCAGCGGFHTNEEGDADVDLVGRQLAGNLMDSPPASHIAS